MKALTYLLKTTIKNYFKRIKEKPQKAVGPIFVLFIFTMMFMPGKKTNASGISAEIFVSLFLLFTIAIFLFALYSGTKSVDSKFSMSDVNLIFVSPIKPQTVMLYGVIKKIALELLTSFYILYQIPNVLRNFKVPVINEVLLVLSYIVFQLVLCNVIKLLIFALNTKYKNLGEIIRGIIKAIILFAVVLIIFLVVKGNFISFNKTLIQHITYDSWVKYIPVFGWIKEIALQTIKGITISYAVYVLLMFALSAVMLYIIYNMELDFYEDMLSSAEVNERVVEAKSGKNVSGTGKTPGIFKPLRNTPLELKGVYGAKVLFFKHMNEYKKRSLVFFINTYSIILFIASIILGIFAKGMTIKPIFLIAGLLLFFTAGFGGKIYNEIYNEFIFLIPDSPQRKLFYGISSSLVKTFTDAVLLFLPFGILSKTSVIEVLLCIVCYVVIGGMLSYSGLFAFRIAEFLGFTGPISQSILFMFFQMLLIVPAFLITLFLTAFFAKFAGLAIYFGLICYGLSAALIFSFGCIGILNDMEFKA